MAKKFDRKKIYHYLLIYLLILWHDTGLKLLVGNSLFEYFVLGISLITIFLNRRCCSKKMLFFCVAITLNVLFVRLVSGGVGIDFLLHSLSAIMITYVAYKYDREHFFSRFVKFVCFLSVVSLIIWMSTLLFPNFYQNLTLFSYSPYAKKFYFSATDYTSIPVVYHGAVFYTMRTGNELIRNNGIFNEPGLYQIILCTALYFILFFSEKISSDKKTIRKYAIIIIITILSCRSTTGYLSLFAIIVGFFLQKNTSKSTKLGIVFALGILIFGIDWIVNGIDSVLGQVVASKIQFGPHGISFTKSAFFRANTTSITLVLLASNPFGMGYDRFVSQLISAGGIYGSGNGLMNTIGALGIQMVAIIIVFFVVPTFKNRKTLMSFLIAMFMYVNTTMGQADIFYPALLILMFPRDGLLPKKLKETNYESIMDV